MKLSNLLTVYHLLFMAFLIIEEASATNKTLTSNRNQLKNNQSRKAERRATIIKCCGATSCMHFRHVSKRSTLLTGNKTVTVVPKILSTEEFTSESTSANTGEVMNENPQDSSPEENSNEPTKKTESTSISRAPNFEPEVFHKCLASVGSDTNLFNPDKTLKDVENYGSWVESCGQQFLFGKKFVTWYENMVQCSKIGMEPLAFEDNRKMKCFKNLTIGWRYNSLFWTSGRRTGETREFSWCSKHGNLLVDGLKQLWAPGQPDFARNEHCLHLKMDKANATYQIWEKSCNNSYILACQGSTTPAPACSSPICPNYTCTKNQLFFANSSKGYYLKDPNLHGNWFKTKGRVFMFSFANRTFRSALQSCCELGMSLLSLEYDYKYLSLQAAIQENVTQKGIFWTSGSDRGCESSFGYCSAKRLLRKEAVWARGQPDNAKGNENSLAVFVNETHALLFDFNEQRTFRYICEARDSSLSNNNTASGGIAIQNECAAVYNVSDAEINTLLSKPQIDTRIKCFMKCLGENTGLIVNGKIIESEIMVVVEKESGSEDKMKKNFLLMDECSNSTKGMDECDQAAQLIQCTNEKAPDVVSGVVNNIVESIPAVKKSSALFPTAICPPPVKCTINVTAKQEFDATIIDSTISTGWVRFGCNKKWLQQNENLDQLGAYQSCCQIGLKLASIEAEAEVQCLRDSLYNSALTWVAGSSDSSPLNPRWCTSQSQGPILKYWFALAFDPALPQLSGFVVSLALKSIKAEDPTARHWSLCV
ncbi:uncharacterized protein LOC132192570 isoform X2 [Neocloeon triangulifer]|uniref:uncharacterized protein LOC132192570 isoform X2 n=1 Tax=Neocloeon triangulifer TaxID=2078957 RepID=UPI00286ECA2F|nr:uncharacterized protein LOC132192570 isoform X2 [Neocloeon triangulifer]